MKYIVYFAIVGLSFQCLPGLRAADAPSTNAVAARVNEHAISRTELDAAMKGLQFQFAQQGRSIPPAQLPEIEHQVLDEMIGRELLLQEAKKSPVPDLETKVDAEMKEITDQVGGEEQFKNSLREAGFTTEQYRQQVRENVMVQQSLRTLTAKLPEVTEQEAKEFYTSNPDKFKRPALAHARHILIRVQPNATDVERSAKRATIDALRARVAKGEDFAEIAKKNSEDPGSAPKGGDLGSFPAGAMVPEFDAVAFSLEPHKLSDVITTQFGFHILEVLDRTPAGTVAFDEVKDRVRQVLHQQKANEFVRKHVQELRTTAKVEVMLAPASAPATPAPAPATTPAKKP